MPQRPIKTIIRASTNVRVIPVAEEDREYDEQGRVFVLTINFNGTPDQWPIGTQMPLHVNGHFRGNYMVIEAVRGIDKEIEIRPIKPKRKKS